MALLSATSAATGPHGDGDRRHFCSIFKDESDQFSAVTPFLLEGLRRNDKCVYISDGLSKEDLFEHLMHAVPEVGDVLDTRISYFTTDDVYLKDGRFDKERMLRSLSDMRDQSLKEGYAGLTATGEMSWASRDVPGKSELLEYEARLNFMYPGSSTDLLCQYSESDFDAATSGQRLEGAPQGHCAGERVRQPLLPPSRDTHLLRIWRCHCGRSQSHEEEPLQPFGAFGDQEVGGGGTQARPALPQSDR